MSDTDLEIRTQAPTDDLADVVALPDQARWAGPATTSTWCQERHDRFTDLFASGAVVVGFTRQGDHIVHATT